MIERRRFLSTGAAGLMLGGCDRLNDSPTFRGVLRSAEGLTRASQRLISSRDALAREYNEADMSPVFRSNGTRMPPAMLKLPLIRYLNPGFSPCTN